MVGRCTVSGGYGKNDGYGSQQREHDAQAWQIGKDTVERHYDWTKSTVVVNRVD